MFGDASEARVLVNDSLDTARRQAAVVALVADGVVTAVAEEERRQVIHTDGQIVLYALRRGLADKYRTVFLPFTTHHEFAALGVYVVAVEIGELGYA